MSKDQVNHPNHYASLSPEPISLIETWGLDYHRGNAIKYIARAGGKDGADGATDLRKAAWYLIRKADMIAQEKKSKNEETLRRIDKELAQDTTYTCRPWLEQDCDH